VKATLPGFSIGGDLCHKDRMSPDVGGTAAILRTRADGASVAAMRQ
jgi:hypothetical protein